jgi:hypothetical protein
MKKHIAQTVALICLVSLGLLLSASTIKIGPRIKHHRIDDETMTRLVALRNDFISRIKAAGYTPALNPPEIVLDNPRSFGNYDNTTNILHTGDWETLPPQAQDIFNKGAARMGNGATGESYFEIGVHQWIFIHELGHWWRACQQQKALPYADELAANRIALAYWREKQPDLIPMLTKRYQGYLNTIPNPVPAGEDKEKYLDENYDKMPGAAAYTWYQSTMIIDALNETPAPTFKQIIERAGNSVSQQ